MKLNALGVGRFQLGASIDKYPDLISPFSAEDRKIFLPDPGPGSWFKYLGDISEISMSTGEVFKGDKLYIAINQQRQINCIQLFPAYDQTAAIDEMLKKEFPLYAVSTAGMGNYGGVKNYTLYIFHSNDGKNTIAYTKNYSSDFGIDEIVFRFANDADALKNYKLVYRSWAQ